MIGRDWQDNRKDNNCGQMSEERKISMPGLSLSIFYRYNIPGPRRVESKVS